MKNVQEFRSSAARVVPLARFAGKSLFLSVMKLFINAKIILVVTYWSLLHNSQTIDKKMNLCGGFATISAQARGGLKLMQQCRGGSLTLC
jgi:hypothetical protein